MKEQFSYSLEHLLGCGIVKHEKGRHLLGKRLAPEDWMDVKAISHPMLRRCG